ncbi:MAG: hypothetical protein Q8M08_14030 [Bacteroidales bacterium]|nr:hypothetical protein [Bacteroidales bacterium]
MTDKSYPYIVFVFILIFSVTGCERYQEPLYTGIEKQYATLPENMIAWNDDRSVSARYVDPTLRYNHGILGDKIEAGGLLVIKNKRQYYFKLDETFVFEDLQPRLKDVDNDGELEFITIQTSLNFGASVCVYKIILDRLLPYAQSGFIGMPYRWLNIAAIDDLDGDGTIEIAWVQTPHIGGVLKISRIENDSLRVVDEIAGVSNHLNGSRNLCLSAVTSVNHLKRLYVPTDPHDAMVGFRFENDHLVAQDTIALKINPAIPLFQQYNFQNLIAETNCIYFPGNH